MGLMALFHPILNKILLFSAVLNHRRHLFHCSFTYFNLLCLFRLSRLSLFSPGSHNSSLADPLAELLKNRLLPCHRDVTAHMFLSLSFLWETVPLYSVSRFVPYDFTSQILDLPLSPRSVQPVSRPALVTLRLLSCGRRVRTGFGIALEVVKCKMHPCFRVFPKTMDNNVSLCSVR